MNVDKAYLTQDKTIQAIVDHLGLSLGNAFVWLIDATWFSWVVTDEDSLQLTFDWLHTNQCSHLSQ